MSDTFHAVIRYRDGRTERTPSPIEVDIGAETVRIEQDQLDIPFEALKAIFFLGEGEPEESLSGTALLVTFEDQEQLRGVAPEYNPAAAGFLMYPVEGDRIRMILVITSAVDSIEVEHF